MVHRVKAFASIPAWGAALLLAASSLLAAGPAAPAAYPRARTVARTGVWKDINAGKAGSAAVAILENGKVVYSEGFGMADREQSVPVDRHTLFNSGSIGKVYVATAVMLLADDGKVKLDAPVVQYLPEFTMADPRHRDITVRMLLNHSSGLPGGTYNNSFGSARNADILADTLANLARSHLKHAPGAMAPYCNEGFTLAEMVVEKVSGKKYIDFLSERLFRPLGLDRTGPAVGERPGQPAAAYYRVPSALREPLEAVSLRGAGGLSSTAEDLCRFMDSFSGQGKQILSRASLEEMKKRQPCLFDGKLRHADMPYGLGWDMTELPRHRAKGLQVLGKSGGTGNYTSMVYTVPDRRITVAVLATGPGSSAMTLALQILDAVLAEKGLLPEEKEAVAKPPEPQDLPAADTRYEGYYSGGDNVVKISFDAAKKTVNLSQWKNGEEKPLTALSFHDGEYFDPSGARYYFFTFDGKDYLVNEQAAFRMDMIAMQRLEKPDNPQQMRIDLNGRQWLRRNVKPFEGAMFCASHCLTSRTLEALPGYVDFSGPKLVQSPDFAGMPVCAMRDLTELFLFDEGGRTWARLSDFLYSPAEEAGALQGGDNRVTIGERGLAEWRKAGADLVLRFEKPLSGRIVVFAPDGTATYDSLVEQGEVYVPRGGFVELAGRPGDAFLVAGRSCAE